MSNLPVDRDQEYMMKMWGTNKLISDYGSLKHVNVYEEKKKFMQEVMEYQAHHLKEQAEMHEKIRNDEDYDDWEYGTEPVYGKPQ